MNPIDILKGEHEKIKRELLELETITESEVVNYSNLIHVLRSLCDMWDKHERKEEKFFPILEKENIKIPVDIMMCSHKDLKPHRKAIVDAINSGSEYETKKALDFNGKILIEKLNKHIDDEDEVLYTLTLKYFTKDELKEMWSALDLG